MRPRPTTGPLPVLLSLLVCLSVPGAARAEPATPTPAQASEAQAQRDRAAANAMAGPGADADSLRDAARQMEAVAAYLDSAAVRPLGEGYLPLYIRNYDVRRDLAAIYARLGETGKALDTLEDMQAAMWLPALVPMLNQDPAFAALRGEAHFQALLKTAALPERLWKGPAADHPYRERLTVEDRVAGLSLFWAEARSYFVHFDHVPDLDWNQVYLDYLPKVMAADTTADYYRVLMRLAPLLQDGHTNIYAPKELEDRFYARPPVATTLVDDKVLVESVNSPSLARRVHPGDEILAIDGLPVRRYAEERVAPFASSSTPQDRAVRTYSYQLLAGDAGTPLKLSLRDAAGSVRDETVARSGYTDVQARPKFAFHMLPGDVAYIALDHFESDAGVQAFRAALPQVMKASALVIDVRRNGGGSAEFGNAILAYLTEASVPHAKEYYRINRSSERRGESDPILWQPPSEFPSATPLPHAVFTGKVAVLTGPKTFSAGEDFVLAFDALKRGITVGEATGGSTGQPMMFALPGGGMARICAKRDLQPDGKPFVGVGLLPAIEAHATVQSVRAGTDTVLQRALAALGAPSS